MDVVGGAFLSALFPVLLKELSSFDLLDYASEGGVLADLQKWKTKLDDMDAVLDVAEERQMTNENVKRWMSDLRDLAYDVEDLLDEFATEVLRRKAMKENVASTSSGVQSFIPACFSGMKSKARFSAKMVSKVKNITAALENMRERQKVHLKIILQGAGPTAPGVMGSRPTSSLMDDKDVIGREKDKEEVLKLMKGEASDGKNIRVVAITGMGGMGKTTLARDIYNEQSLEFDKRAWVSVGEGFDVVNMTKAILDPMGGNPSGKDYNGLQEELKRKLQGNKVLIILDDVWNSDYNLWINFYRPFGAAAPGSRIIVTTRDEHVSRMMASRKMATTVDSAIQSHSLEKLSDEHCLLIFVQHALGAQNFDAYPDLKDIGEGIVDKCDGLPLAAMSLGGLLRGNLDRTHWTRVLNSPIWDLKEEKSILPALKLSYHHLHPPLKRLFIYCAIFPKEYEFDKNELVLLWMAEGLLGEVKKVYEEAENLGQKKVYEEEEKLGHFYFDQLFSKSFFQKSPTTKSRFVMHDLIVDLARSVSQDICIHLEDKVDNAEKVRHSSFMREKIGFSQKSEIFCKMNRLRTFLSLPISSTEFWNPSYITSKVLNDLVPEFKCLRVLSLDGYRLANLPSSISSLMHLRYLDLSYTEITRLPESFCRLTNLQTLRLRGCQSLIELPAGIGNLIKLLHLDIGETSNLKEMPPQIGNLGDLRTLSKFVVGKGNGLTIEKLNNFPHLRGELHIMGLHNVVVEDVGSSPSYLEEKGGLSKLVLEWVDDCDASRNENGELKVLNSLRPPYENLEELSIKFYAGMQFPSWIGDRNWEKMVFLELCSCPKISVLPPLWQLPSLTKLIVEDMNRVKTVGVEFHGDSSAAKTFQSLETLIIKNLIEWEQWSQSNAFDEDEISNFPELRELRMINCSKLVGQLPIFLPSLETLEISGCPLLSDLPKRLPPLRELNVEDCQEVVLRLATDIASISSLTIKRIAGLESLHDCLSALDKHSSLKRLEVSNCEQLVSLVDGDEELLPYTLESLDVNSCSNLEKLPRGLHSLTSLKHLSVVDCPKLVSFPTTGLPLSIEDLNIERCSSLESLPKRLTLDVNNSNEKSHLEDVYISGCPSLMSFPIGDFPNSLMWFSICGRATQVLDPLNEGLLRLTNLLINNCPELESFPEGGLAIPTLKYLCIRNCDKLKALPNNMVDLDSLQTLQMYDCPSLRSFPEGGFPKNLISLYIITCDNLSQPLSSWRLNQLTCLKSLVIKGACPSTDMVKSIPSGDGRLLPTSLTHLGIFHFKNLKSISKGLQVLTSLRTLQIWWCPQLKRLPKKGIPSTLGAISLLDCPLLEKRCSKDLSRHIPWVDTANLINL